MPTRKRTEVGLTAIPSPEGCGARPKAHARERVLRKAHDEARYGRHSFGRLDRTSSLSGANAAREVRYLAIKFVSIPLRRASETRYRQFRDRHRNREADNGTKVGVVKGSSHVQDAAIF